jgi:hypothetical protein
MYPRIVRQIVFIGSVGALEITGLIFALSKSINQSLSWQRRGCQQFATNLSSRPSEEEWRDLVLHPMGVPALLSEDNVWATKTFSA